MQSDPAPSNAILSARSNAIVSPARAPDTSPWKTYAKANTGARNVSVCGTASSRVACVIVCVKRSRRVITLKSRTEPSIRRQSGASSPRNPNSSYKRSRRTVLAPANASSIPFPSIGTIVRSNPAKSENGPSRSIVATDKRQSSASAISRVVPPPFFHATMRYDSLRRIRMLMPGGDRRPGSRLDLGAHLNPAAEVCVKGYVVRGCRDVLEGTQVPIDF